jgi:molybdenum cofactor cytidylyltransferase
MVIPSDHPFLDSTLIDLLLARFLDSERDICVPCYKGRRGVPVSFASRFYDEIMAIRGDIGAREIVLKNPESVLEVELQDDDSFIDIDTEEDLDRLKDRHASFLRPLRK